MTSNPSPLVTMYRNISFAVISFCLCSRIFGQDVDELVNRFEIADGPAAAGIAANELFAADIPYDDSEKLVNHDNPSIALLNAWRIHHRELPPKQFRFGITPVISYLPDIQRFVGYVEGRLRTQVPEWWEEMLESPDKHHPSRTGLLTEKWLAFPPIDTKAKPQSIELTSTQDRLAVPTETIQWLVQGLVANEYTVVSHEDSAFIVSKPTSVTGSRIACIELQTGHERWRNEIWGTNHRQIAFSGPPLVPADVLSFNIANGTLTIFGAKSVRVDYTRGHAFLRSAFYVEQYSMLSGDCIVRFSTNNWAVNEEQE